MTPLLLLFFAQEWKMKRVLLLKVVRRGRELVYSKGNNNIPLSLYPHSTLKREQQQTKEEESAKMRKISRTVIA